MLTPVLESFKATWPTPELDRETWSRRVVNTLRENVRVEREAGIHKYHDVTYITSGTHLVMGTRTGSDADSDVYEVFDMEIQRYGIE